MCKGDREKEHTMADVKSIEKAIEQAADEIAAKKREMSADQLETAMYFAAQRIKFTHELGGIDPSSIYPSIYAQVMYC